MRWADLFLPTNGSVAEVVQVRPADNFGGAPQRVIAIVDLEQASLLPELLLENGARFFYPPVSPYV